MAGVSIGFKNKVFGECGFSPVVPAPPSLDTLHMMTKQNPDPSKRMSTSTTSEGRQSLGSPSFPHSPVEQSELTASPRSSVKQDHQYENATIDESRERFLLQGARPKEYSDIDHKDETENNTRTSSVSLDPNYHSVRDSVHDLDVEFDPNYESVEEAQNKVAHPHNRKHEYEEVKKVSDDVSKLREQVLRRHTYEDIVDVKEQTEELKRKSGEIK